MYCAYTSSDGVTWLLVSNSCATLATSGPVLAGMAITSHNSGTLGSANFDTVAIGTSAPKLCPAGWTCADVGGATPAGDQALNGGTWTIDGGGTDIWGTSDKFHYVWQTLPGDGAMTARVDSQTNTGPWAKAGVMLRQTTDPGSAYYAAYTTPSNGIVVQYRSSQGGNAVPVASVAGTPPTYLRVAVSANTFTAYTSTDGVTWVPIAGSSVTFGMNGPRLAGMAVTSHTGSMVSQVAFERVTVG
jgi:hypothetical protein